MPPLSCADGAVLVELSRQDVQDDPHERSWRDHCILALLFHYDLPTRTLAALTLRDVVGVHIGASGPVSIWTGPHHPENTLLDLPDHVAEPLRTYLRLRADRQQAPLRQGR